MAGSKKKVSNEYFAIEHLTMILQSKKVISDTDARVIMTYLTNKPMGSIDSGTPDPGAGFHSKIVEDTDAKCGYNGAGHAVYVINEHPSRPVRATVVQHGSRGSKRTLPPVTLDPNNQKAVGCTRAGSLEIVTYRYEVVGEVVL